MPWRAAAVVSCPPSVSQCSPKYVSPRQKRKLGHRQAQVGQVIAIQLLLLELFSSASSRLLILFIKLHSGLWCFSSVCSRLRSYSGELSIMTATEDNANIFKTGEAEACRKSCCVKHESENTWPLALGKVSFVLKCCDEPEVACFWHGISICSFLDKNHDQKCYKAHQKLPCGVRITIVCDSFWLVRPTQAVCVEMFITGATREAFVENISHWCNLSFSLP